MPVTDNLSPELEGRLFESPDARDARRQEKLASLDVYFSAKPRGKNRPSHVEALLPAPQPIPDYAIIELGRLLRQEPDPVLDEITKYPTPKPKTWDAIERYIMGANTHTTTKGSSFEERTLIRKGLRRQTQHVADRVQRDFRNGWQIARMRRAALSSAQNSIREGNPILSEAAHIASDAIEDLGVTLRDHPVAKKVSESSNIALDLERLGVYAVDEPDILREQPLVLRMVQIEQAKREEFWGEYYSLTIENDRDRRTAADKEQDQAIEALIGRLTAHVTTE